MRKAGAPMTALALVTVVLALSIPVRGQTHGLTGRYYVSELPTHALTEKPMYFTQIWVNQDDFQLPEPLTDAAALRIDPQIAFGQGKGFKTGANPKHADWAPADYPAPPGFTATDHKPWDRLAAVEWNGYVHLPKAGTYYFATVSDGSSAVYLNQSRVALNGPASHYGALLTSDAFAYDEQDVRDFIQNVRGTPFARRTQDAYSIPVSVDSPRDVSIKVRYNASNQALVGIDLLWVTPESPKDANGKPLLKVVPADALYTDAPAPIAPPDVRGVNSTVSADRYCSSMQGAPPITLTFRLADKDGRPISGKRVLFTTVANEDFGFDERVQADRPTDADGVTTAHLKPSTNARAHSSTVFATDVSDLVDIGQVAHVRFVDAVGLFASPCTAGFDPDLITVSPLPMTVGRPLTLTVKLENRYRSAIEFDAVFQRNNWNIGASDWGDIGEVQNIRLLPGEARDVSVAWTPTEQEIHQCFRVQLHPRKQSARNSELARTRVLPVALFENASADTQIPVPGLAGPWDYNQSPTVQRNVGPVSGTTPWGFDKSYWYNVEVRSQTVAGICRTILVSIPEALGPAVGAGGVAYGISQPIQDLTAKAVARLGGGKAIGRAAGIATLGLKGVCAWSAVAGGIAHAIASDPPDPSFQQVYEPYQYELPPSVQPGSAAQPYAAALDGVLRNQLKVISLSTAVLVSIERYQGATMAHDRAAAERQMVASRNYAARAIQEFNRGALLLNAFVQALPVGMRDVTIPAEQTKAAQQQLEQKGFDDEELTWMAWVGVSEDFMKSEILPSALRVDPAKASGTFEQTLQDLAETYRRSQEDLATPLQNTFAVANPHDKEETIDLFVSPLSMPAGWTTSVLNADAAPFRVTEIDPGKHYAVTLPAKASIHVKSVVGTRSEVGTKTTARWAVEGRIRGEDIGAMIHEMTVPDSLGPEPPPSVPAALPAPVRRPFPRSAVMSAAVIVVFVLGFIVMWIRKRHAR